MKRDIKYLENQAREVRKLSIKAIGQLGVGHIGGVLSIVDVVTALFFDVMNIDEKDPGKADRDRFILSKGHGGPAIYAALALRDFIDVSELDTLNRPNTKLPSHCDRVLTRGIDMSTGSLGQGFSAATGMAVAAQMDQSPLYVYTIIGDGESQEGQIWEAAMLAGSRKLDNLIAFTDYNRMQIDGTTDDINGLDPLDAKWRAFNWHVQVIDGHDMAAILTAVEAAQQTKGQPSMIILKTIKGKGAKFCEGQLTSHNMPVTEAMWKEAYQALSEEVQ